MTQITMGGREAMTDMLGTNDHLLCTYYKVSEYHSCVNIFTRHI